MFISLTDFVVRVGVALILGSLIGAEREWRNKLAGLKTNALVCVGSALFTCIGFYAGAASEYADPTRIAAQIASGIGFLGAGVIMRDGMSIRGLTTAATVWCAVAGGLGQDGAIGEGHGGGWIVDTQRRGYVFYFRKQSAVEGNHTRHDALSKPRCLC